MSIPNLDPLRPITQADLEEHNIQGLVELSYVKTANDVLADSLTSLQSALNITNNVLTTLTGLQNLHNQVIVSGRGTINFDYAAGGGDSYLDNYTNAASAFFGRPIDPRFAFSNEAASGYPQFQTDIQNFRDQLIVQAGQLSGITPILSGTGQIDPNSLLARIRTVLTDLNRFDLGSFSGVSDWVLDGYDVHGEGAVAAAGLIQQNLTFAITAGQSLNNTQTETVRRYLFLFEEYYKSASSILQAITQIIQKMADGITTT